LVTECRDIAKVKKKHKVLIGKFT
jgi:hypothetical protein